MRLEQFLKNEAAYTGNLGIEELFKFYDVANAAQIKKMETILKKNDWNAYKKLIKEVLGVNLV